MVSYRETPCETCEWPYRGFHICLGLPQEIMRKVEDGEERDSNGAIVNDAPSKVRTTRSKYSNLTHNEAIAEGIRRKHANDPKIIARNEKIVRLYDKEQMSMKRVAEVMELDKNTVRLALKRAEERREVTIRPQGFQLKES